MGLALCLGGAGGCAAPRAATKPPADAEGVDLAAMRHDARVQSKRIAELETRLSLLEAEWRDGRSASRMAPRETVVIGGRHARRHADDVDAPDETDGFTGASETSDEPPVTLILDERPVEPMASSQFVASTSSGAPEPAGSAGLPGLGVVPLPGARVDGAVAVQPAEARAQYRQALSLVRARRFDQALIALSSFLGRYPTHRLADRALYWRGEVEYAQRDYARALQTFEALQMRFPQSAKRADALLKTGYCHRRLGDEGAAESAFRRVRKEFPESEAARTASGEGAS